MAASIAARVSRYGAWAPMVLFSWVNTRNVYLPAEFAFCNTYLGFTLVMAAVVAACLRRRPQGDGCGDGQSGWRRALDWAACLGMSAACVLVVSPRLFGASPYLALTGSLAAGLGIGWSYVRWALCLARFGLRDLIRIVFAGCVVWTAVRTSLNALPLPASTAAAALVPFLSAAMLGSVRRQARGPARPASDGAGPEDGGASAAARAYPHNGGFSTWRLWVVVVAITLSNQLLVGGTAPYLGNLDDAVYPVKALCSACLMALVLVWTLKTNLAFDFVLLWRGLYMLAACALLVVSFAQAGPVLWVASSIAADLLVPVLWLTVCTVARHTSIPSPLVVGTGLGAYGLTSFAGLFVGGTVPAAVGLAPLCTALLFMLFIVLALCLDSRNPDLLQLFDDLRGRQVRGVDLALIDARCAAIGAERGLTPREVEVMRMLCAGRSRSYVAETLYISENTVKTHADRLYKKLGVHSREELQRLAGV